MVPETFVIKKFLQSQEHTEAFDLTSVTSVSILQQPRDMANIVKTMSCHS